MLVIKSKQSFLDISVPVVMGILNATPDSFYNKGRESSVHGLLLAAERMVQQGASILDIGGASTRPGQDIIGAGEELERIMPVIEAVRRHFPDVWLSVDTYNSKVAASAVAAGVNMVNDVSAGSIDAGMLATVAALDVPYIAMHMQGVPATMQDDPRYDDVVTEVLNYLAGICERCADAGISDVIVDPGFGFGKTVAHNFSLLRSLHELTALGKPILAGLSRKSIVCKPLRVNPEHALNGTTALHMVALQQGANILRVHDVKEAMETITLFQQLQNKL